MNLTKYLSEYKQKYTLAQTISGKWEFRGHNIPQALKGKYFKEPYEAIEMANKMGIHEKDINYFPTYWQVKYIS